MQLLAGNTAIFIFPLCILFVFLTHSAEYESWLLPLAIIMIVPMSLLCALAGAHLRGMDNNLFTQIGFVVLAGLACKNAVRAMQMPVDNLVSNWAYMVMASLAWTLKAWLALSLPEAGRWAAKYTSEKQSVLKMEFKKFLNTFMRVPCQIVRTGRRILYRLLAWNPWQSVFLRAVNVLRRPPLSTMAAPGPLRC